MPFATVERVEKIVCDYSASGRVPRYALWDSRYGCLLKGKKLSSLAHTEEYMNWYRANTIMYISRGQAHEEIDTTKAKRDEYEGCYEQKNVKDLLLHMERSVDRAVLKKTSIEHFWNSWIRKIFRFRSGLNTEFVKFKDDFLYSSASEDESHNSHSHFIVIHFGYYLHICHYKQGRNALTKKRISNKKMTG
ncbi:hypothetical protein MRB53_020864 [Persea americana]|uniref:Uncharacterized protein n=1 Tax=Persea americana TaxID=3435 RepID=A0ACC2L391_PERAE|nr:hypothetical protein MRB53_020864 [Persea americana]